MKPNLAPIREFKRLAESALPGRVKKVVLYGSRARGNARPGSDWDVAVFIKGRVAAKEATALSHIGSDLFFDPVGISTPSYCRLDEKPKTAPCCAPSARTVLLSDCAALFIKFTQSLIKRR